MTQRKHNHVTYLNAMSFGSVSSIPFTAPARFFISLHVKVVKVRLVEVFRSQNEVTPNNPLYGKHLDIIVNSVIQYAII